MKKGDYSASDELGWSFIVLFVAILTGGIIMAVVVILG